MQNCTKDIAQMPVTTLSPPRTPEIWGPEARKTFLEALANTGDVAAAAQAAGLSRATLYARRDRNQAFRKAWDKAMDAALDQLESTLLQRALNGVEKPVYYAGKEVGVVRHFSDTLAMFLLKGRKPGAYGGAAMPAEPEDHGDPNAARLEIEARLNRLAEGLE
jgi:hypothetical protein